MEESSTDEETLYVPYSLIVKKVLKINELTWNGVDFFFYWRPPNLTTNSIQLK